MPSDQQSALLEKLEREKATRLRTNRLKHYGPYAKQREFHNTLQRERLFMAGNQLGKTWAGAYETAMHLTGEYPDWWQGRRFEEPVIWLAGSESAELTRDGVQRLLIGPPDREEEWGTGAIPMRALADRTRRMGVANALDSVTVRHVSGGYSTLYFKSYDQGRTKWQANTVHGVWFDEEPPQDVYFEGITRTNATKGLVMVTFTPLKGMSEVVARYLLQESEDRAVVTMTIEDAEHFTAEERAKIIASYPPHERDARTRGIPTLGSGLIFPVDENDILVEPFSIPETWHQIVGVDFGFDHPFAAVRLAHDTENDVIYVVSDYRKSHATPVIHAAAIKPWGDWLPIAWPHDGLRRDKDQSGKEYSELYREQGLDMLPEKATFDDGGFGVEAGVIDMLDRMQTGRWKVFKGCNAWLEERRLYHRKDGVIVKERDDAISASRYAYMMRRHAALKPKRRGMDAPDQAWVA